METAFAAAVRCHRGQMYGRQPYIAHLASVVAVLMDFGFAADSPEVSAGWLHDVLEDTPFTPDILDVTEVGAMVWACSGFGKDRLARNHCIAQKIAEYPPAAVVKLADRIANVEQTEPGSRHHWIYLAENPDFELVIRKRVPAPMWDRLEAAFADKMQAVRDAAQ